MIEQNAVPIYERRRDRTLKWPSPPQPALASRVPARWRLRPLSRKTAKFIAHSHAQMAMQATNIAATAATVAEHQQGLQPPQTRAPNSQRLRPWLAAGWILPSSPWQASTRQNSRFRRTQYKYLFARIIGPDHAQEHLRSDHDCVSGPVLDLCAHSVFPVPE